jgi:hypothetical protein
MQSIDSLIQDYPAALRILASKVHPSSARKPPLHTAAVFSSASPSLTSAPATLRQDSPQKNHRYNPPR